MGFDTPSASEDKAHPDPPKTEEFFVKSILTSVVLLSAFAGPAAPMAFAENDPGLSQALRDSLTGMKSVYDATYAPTKWKEKNYNWSISAEYQKALGAIGTRGSDLNVKDAREIAKNFVYSTRDYHVSIAFKSTELAVLPFTVRSAEGKYFISYINTDRLGPTIFPFHVGDELVTFDGLATADAVNKVKAEIPANIPTTDAALAELYLTNRRGARGYNVPSGPITVGVKPQGQASIVTRQLIWEYTPEMVPGYSNSPGIGGSEAPRGLIGQGFGAEQPTLAQSFNKMMSHDYADLAAPDNPQGLGTKKSYLPALGPKIWEADASDVFDASIVMTADRKLVGVIRIPSYVPADTTKALASFSKLVERMEAATDGLVIDQLNNPGGSVFYLYSLVSMLSDHPMKTPLHSMSVTPADVFQANSDLQDLAAVTDDASARKVLGETIDGYPVDFQVAQFAKNYSKFMMSEWKAGRTMTTPYWISGVDSINPNPVHYTKPILILVNELDFSGGDFFPATMQDNGRAKIMGVRTSGAGGYVSNFTFPNLVGIDYFRVTQSIASRVSNDPIENLGVTPDFIVPFTAADRQGGYQEFAKTALDTILKMVGPTLFGSK
jgi:hypothetical protein